MGHTVHYYQDGQGPCAQPDPLATSLTENAVPTLEEGVTAVEEPVEPIPVRGIGAWARGLNEDGWGLASFIVGIFAGRWRLQCSCASHHGSS